MPDQKLENLLNLSLEATPKERLKSVSLGVGYDPLNDHWEVIVRHTGDLSFLSKEFSQITVTNLLGNFSIVSLPSAYLPVLSALPNVSFIEKPKRLFFSAIEARQSSCITSLYQSPWNLNGEGILIGIVDSGITLTHPDFQNSDGTTRFIRFWDQTSDGTPPVGYPMGTEWSSEQINTALRDNLRLPEDRSGHGTAVAGIAAGNGAASQGRYQGIAPKASMIAVRLGSPSSTSFPRTTQLMMGIDYCIRTAAENNLPLALNLSFGNNYGSHDGSSLLETYINAASGHGRVTICTGSGNEGASGTHAFGKLSSSVKTIELSVGSYEPSFNIQLWKNYVDEFSIVLESPSGISIGPILPLLGPQRLMVDRTELLIFYGEPSPFSTSQEIYIDFIPIGSYVGKWDLENPSASAKNNRRNLPYVATRRRNLKPQYPFSVFFPGYYAHNTFHLLQRHNCRCLQFCIKFLCRFFRKRIYTISYANQTRSGGTGCQFKRSGSSQSIYHGYRYIFRHPRCHW